MSHEPTPSRSARKRDSQARQQLGERLVNLKPEELARIPLPEELAAAIHLARRITERGGRRRQLQYIGKLMRRIDTVEIERALATIAQSHHDEADELHRAEQWRDTLLEEGAAGIDRLAQQYPELDRVRLNALVHAAAAEAASGHPPRSARALYRYLRDEVFGKQNKRLPDGGLVGQP